MKSILRIYKTNPIVALVINSIGFFIWAITVIFLIVIMAVAFGH
jgi:cytochrome c oxidase assembly factor CtaG